MSNLKIEETRKLEKELLIPLFFYMMKKITVVLK